MALLPGLAMSAPVDADLPEQAGAAAATLGVAESHAPATETLRGQVASVEQDSDSISIRLPAGRTERFRVQDGLVFDAIRFGDLVELSVQTIEDIRTIVGLSEQ
jgi:hypothetical protein